MFHLHKKYTKKFHLLREHTKKVVYLEGSGISWEMIFWMLMEIRVMIVDDSIFIRAVLKQIIESDEEKRFKVVASARDGIDALEKLMSYDVDVITMDVDMPKMNGLETVKEIMKTKPTPIIMISSLTKKGADETVKSLAHGAIDFITKPDSKYELSELKDEIYDKLYTSFKFSSLQKRTTTRSLEPEPEWRKASSDTLNNLVLIGCSTGGPKALQKLTAQIPVGLPAAFVVVQHMPGGGFTTSLANHLNEGSSFTVKEAEDGEEIKDGIVYIAPGGYHTEIFIRSGRHRLVLNKREPVSGHRPSVDVLFASVGRLNSNLPLYGMILTGMGGDGTKGCQSIKSRNATIFAESEETAIIYGMPKQAVNAGVVDHILKLEDIIPSLSKSIM
jgi:two-component system, chemotaxis family, protein-glutamate methylesterase/glutaminase